MENEKLFEFMEKMYNEMQKGFKDVKKDIIKNTESIIALEGELKLTKKTLPDGYRQNYEAMSELKEIVKKNSEDIEEINMSLGGMKEDINFIVSKTLRNDSKIDKIKVYFLP